MIEAWGCQPKAKYLPKKEQPSMKPSLGFSQSPFLPQGNPRNRPISRFEASRLDLITQQVYT
jgi:hypothetical protein